MGLIKRPGQSREKRRPWRRRWSWRTDELLMEEAGGEMVLVGASQPCIVG